MKTRLFSPRVRDGLPLPKSFLFTPAAVILALALFHCSLPTGAQAQVDDFAGTNDIRWSHYDPLGAVAQSAKATYSFPAGGYRIQAQPFTAAGPLGPALISCA